MDFIKKAKKTMKELEGDLNKATSALGIDSKIGSSASSSAPGVPTPAASSNGSAVAPPAAAGPPPAGLELAVKPKDGAAGKLPMTVRKNIRDEWDTKVQELNERLSAILKTPWVVHADIPNLYTYFEQTYAKERPGNMTYDYFEAACRKLESFLETQGEDGRKAINALAPHHYMTLEPEKIETRNGADFNGGKLRIVVRPDEFAVNIDDAFAALGDAINQAETQAHGADALPFHTRVNIRDFYDAKIDEVLADARSALHRPDLTFTPNLELNYAAIKSWTEANPREADGLPHGWDKRIGGWTTAYFQTFAEQLRSDKFDEDDMMREAFFDLCTTANVAVRVVDEKQMKSSSSRNEIEMADGTCYIQISYVNFGVNITDCAQNLVKIL